MEETTRLDEVTIFGGKLSFLIPHDWEETVEENLYLYSQPKTDSGWFRVSLNTSRAVGEMPAERLRRLFEGRQNLTHDERTGNVVCSYERDAEEEGVKIHLYYWIVANVVEPDLVREAVFSYAVLSERTSEEQTRKMLNLIGQMTSRAIFNSES
jgi:hypothetical protein